MGVDVLLGLQWGDEGKGKIVDVLTPQYDIIARFQGGPNAGHTLEFEGIKHVLHTIPSGIFRDNVVNLIGNGVVIDPVQSVKGKVVMDAFRSIDPASAMQGKEPRQTTSNIGHIAKPSLVALARGLNKHYYSIAINYRKSESEQRMLLNLNKVNWSNSLKQKDYKEGEESNIDTMKNLCRLTADYKKWI